MTFSTHQLFEIVQNASNFEQRINGNFQKELEITSQAKIEKMLTKWRETVAFGDQNLLEKRFAWDNIDYNKVIHALSKPKWKNENPLPRWTSYLAEVAEEAKKQSIDSIYEDSYLFFNKKSELPFQHAFIPFINVARKNLKEAVPEAYYLFQPSVHASLERSLLGHLTHLCQQTLYLEFSILRTKKPSHKHPLPSSSSTEPNLLYTTFINSLFKSGFVPFFMEYTVLARLVSTAMEFWVVTNKELLSRLKTDWSMIGQTFALQSKMGDIESVQTRLSDPHNNGRTVSILSFSSGEKLVYKPKNLGLDSAFYNLISWFNDQNPTLPLKAVKILDRQDYGWAKFIHSAPCLNQEAVQRYYQRIGMILCLVYVLEGTDCHNENLIAAGEYPILIDIETLLHPRIDPTGSEDATGGAQNLAHQQYLNSVLRTALLPLWMFGQGGQSFDISGLGAIEGQTIPSKRKEWSDINSDRMKVTQVQSVATLPAVSPPLNGKPTSADDYLEEIIIGFEETYKILIEKSSELLHEEGPVVKFRYQKSRFVFRNTMNYFLLSEKLLHPKFMRDGMERSIQLDVLTRSALRSTNKPEFWPLIRSEKDAMEVLDIPYFFSSSEGESISSSDRILHPEFFSATGYSVIFDRIRSLGIDDMERQIGFIRAAFKLRFKQSEEEIQAPPFQLKINDTKPASREELVNAAVDVAQDVVRQAVIASDGSASWLGFEHVLEAGRSVIQPLGYNLHSGTAGIALFLAAMEKTRPGDGYGKLALGALHQFRTSLRKDHKITKLLSQRMSLGGAIGLGAIIYSMTRIHDLLDEPSLLEDAEFVADCIGFDRIANDTKFDVMDGAAGAILGLLALYERTGTTSILEKAVACGHHLVNGRVQSQSGEHVWPTVDPDILLTGFSHGAAGIAYALLRLYEVTHNPTLLAVALEAIQYEAHQLVPEQQNWPDLLRSTPNNLRYGNTWCHGAPGIGLARLGSLHILDNKQVRNDIDAAFQSTSKMFGEDLDTICCGNLGRSELFISGATILNDQSLQNKMALRQMAWVLKHRYLTGSYRMPYGLGHGYNHEYQLGFFHGLAGIGYQLLRASQPKELPSILLWK